MIHNDFWVGMFLVDASTATSKAFGANIGIIGWKYASYFPPAA